MVYFRFRNAKNATTPMTQATATAASMANSVMLSGASVVTVGSANICVEAEVGLFTAKYVDADELP